MTSNLLNVTVRLGSWWLFPRFGLVGLSARDYLGEILRYIYTHIHREIYCIYIFYFVSILFIWYLTLPSINSNRSLYK